MKGETKSMKKIISKNTVICFVVMAMALLLLPYNKVNAEGYQDWYNGGDQEYPVTIGGTAELAVNVYAYDYITDEEIDITTDCSFQWCKYTGGDIYDALKLTTSSYRDIINGATESTYTVNNINTAEQYICLVTYNGLTQPRGFSVYPDNSLSVEAVDDEGSVKGEYGKDANIAAYVYADDFTNMTYELQKQVGYSWVYEKVNGANPVIETVSPTCRKITYIVKSTMDNIGTYRIIATDKYDTTKRCDFFLRFALKVNYSPDVSVQSGKDVTLTVKPSIDETVDKDISFEYSWWDEDDNEFEGAYSSSLTLKNVTKEKKIYCNIYAYDDDDNYLGGGSAIFNIKVVKPTVEAPAPVPNTPVIWSYVKI